MMDKTAQRWYSRTRLSGYAKGCSRPPTLRKPLRVRHSSFHGRINDCVPLTRSNNYPKMSLAGRSDHSMPALEKKQANHAVAVVTTVGCPYCKQVKDALSKADITYDEIDMSDRGTLFAKCKELTGLRTVPQVFVGGSLVGGASETIKLIDNGSLPTMVERTNGVSLYDGRLFDALFAPISGGGSVGAAAGGYFDTVLWLRMIQKEYQSATTSSDVVDPEDLDRWMHEEGAKYIRKDIGMSLVSAMVKHKVLVEQKPGTFVWSSTIPLISGKVSKTPLNSHIKVLNTDKSFVDPIQFSEMLRSLVLILYDEYLSTDGSHVDYRGLLEDERFRAFVNVTTDLQSLNISALTSFDERMCFWINMYNALIVHAIAVFGPAASTLERLTWFGDISYVIGGYRFSANDIEHGILRGNASNPASIWNLVGISCLAEPMFPSGDPRQQFAVAKVDPRIHFALNCGAKSCPPIKVYSPEKLEEGLQASAEAFCSSEVTFNPNTNTLNMSSIFKWYGADFGETQKERIEYLLPYISKETRDALEELPRETFDSIKITFSKYDWSS